MINNRQAGRRRGRGGNGQRQGGNPGRPDNGNRIDSRARGNANQLYEKYKNLASDAQRQGDRVNTEYYLQFADHYFRVLSESRSRFDDGQQQQQRRGRDDGFVNGFDSDFDAFDGEGEFGDEGEPIRSGEQAGEQQPSYQRREREDERLRERAAQEGGRRGEGRRDEPRRQDERRREVNGHAEPVAEREPVAAVPPVANDVDPGEEAPVARRRGRPRRDRSGEDAAPAGIPAAIGVDRLPPALNAAGDEATTTEAGEGAEPKPRRRRVRAVNGAEAPLPVDQG